MDEWEEYLSPPDDIPEWAINPEDYPCWILSCWAQTYGGVVHRIAGGYDAYAFAKDHCNDVRGVFDTLEKAKKFIENHIINHQWVFIDLLQLHAAMGLYEKED